MTDEIVLKPCPFCGGRPDVHETVTAFGICYAKPWVAECGNDGCHAIIEVLGDSEEDAHRKWNIRSALFPADARTIIAKVVKDCIASPPNKSETSFADDVAGAVLAALWLGR